MVTLYIIIIVAQNQFYGTSLVRDYSRAYDNSLVNAL